MEEIVPHVFAFSKLRVGRAYLLTEGDGLLFPMVRKRSLMARFRLHGRPVTANAAQFLGAFAQKVGAI